MNFIEFGGLSATFLVRKKKKKTKALATELLFTLQGCEELLIRSGPTFRQIEAANSQGHFDT